MQTRQISLTVPTNLLKEAKNYAEKFGYLSIQELILDLIRETVMQKNIERYEEISKLETDLQLELHVPDFNKVIKFYSLLGFKVTKQSERYLTLKRGKTFIHFNEGSQRVFKQSYFKNFPKNTKRGYAVEIVIPVENVEEFYEQVKDKVKIVQPLILKRWGKKDFRVEDPFGFYLRITEPHNPIENSD